MGCTGLHMVSNSKWWHARSIGHFWCGWCAMPRMTSFFSHCWLCLTFVLSLTQISVRGQMSDMISNMRKMKCFTFFTFLGPPDFGQSCYVFSWLRYCSLFVGTVKPLYSEQSRDPKKVHYTRVFTQGGEICGDPDMFMHTCMCLLHILKLTSQISLTFGFGLFDKS